MEIRRVFGKVSAGACIRHVSHSLLQAYQAHRLSGTIQVLQGRGSVGGHEPGVSGLARAGAGLGLGLQAACCCHVSCTGLVRGSERPPRHKGLARILPY